MDRQEALELAATARLLMNLAKAADATAKARLSLDLDPGDRKVIRTGGYELGTVSRDRINETDVLVITDEAALIAWLDEHEGGDGVARHVMDWKRADLEAAVIHHGSELPDGTSIHTKTSGGSIRVNQTDAQATNLIQQYPTLIQRALPATQGDDQ